MKMVLLAEATRTQTALYPFMEPTTAMQAALRAFCADVPASGQA